VKRDIYHCLTIAQFEDIAHEIMPDYLLGLADKALKSGNAEQFINLTLEFLSKNSSDLKPKPILNHLNIVAAVAILSNSLANKVPKLLVSERIATVYQNLSDIVKVSNVTYDESVNEEL
jgi:hypothetical protein